MASPAHASPSLGARLFVAMQYALAQHLLSRAVYHLTRSRIRPLKNALIGSFVRGFRPDMQEAAQPDPLVYDSFNEFFTRPLRSGARSIDFEAGTLVSPVDGTISQIGQLDGSRLLQAKGHHYTLETLLGAETGPGAKDTAAQWARRLTGGAFATLYLAPFNYHRIHMPVGGTVRAAWYIPGRLFSVNATTAAAVPGLFARNERVVCVFEDGPLCFAMVLVGALFVGSMDTVWHGEITPRKPRGRLELPIEASRAPTRLEKGAEMGRFNMGSTVILLLPPSTADWLADLHAGDRITMGQPLAQLHSSVIAP